MPRIDFIILRQSALARDSRHTPFDNPPFGQNGKRVLYFRGNMPRRIEPELRVMARVATIPRVRGGRFEGGVLRDQLVFLSNSFIISI